MAMQGVPGPSELVDIADPVKRELDAISKIIATLAPFDEPDKARMLQYIFSKVVVSPVIRQQMVAQYEATRRIPNPNLTEDE